MNLSVKLRFMAPVLLPREELPRLCSNKCVGHLRAAPGAAADDYAVRRRANPRDAMQGGGLGVSKEVFHKFAPCAGRCYVPLAPGTCVKPGNDELARLRQERELPRLRLDMGEVGEAG